jgi:tetratricopeptide (TPR) repeat protein
MTTTSFPLARLPAPRSARLAGRRLAILLLASLGSVTAASGAQSPADQSTQQSIDDFKCGVLNPPGQFGPFDYRTATRDQKYIVEVAHFAPHNEALMRGTSTDRPGPDIDYTLRAFPNHARALKSMMDLRFRDKANPPVGMRYTAECWFNRALRFTPDDPQVRMVYGIFLLRSGDKRGAIEQLELARAYGLSSANFHYNMGLAYFQVQDYEKARVEAYKAKELGFQLEGLKNMLTRAGQWREPPPSAPEQPDEDAQGTGAPAAPQPVAPKN